jgi:hypothetical protein
MRWSKTAALLFAATSTAWYQTSPSFGQNAAPATSGQNGAGVVVDDQSDPFAEIPVVTVERSPGAGFMSQRHTIPAAMNEIAIGNR